MFRTRNEARVIRTLLGFALASVVSACGSSDSSSGSSGAGGDSGAGSGGTGSATGGSGGSATGGSAGSSAGGNAGAGLGGTAGSAGSAGACAATPNTIPCGNEVCDLETSFCCGGSQGKCLALGAFCGLGGGLKMFCDDKADCAADEVCCPSEVENPGNDAPYQTSCKKPAPFPDDGPYGCGFSGGNLAWPALCACTADCSVGTCKPGSILVPTIGTDTMRCE
jgi:hypothetical protein